MYTLEQITEIGNQYIKELTEKGRIFNPIKFELLRKSMKTYGVAIASYSKYTPYDTIRINPYIVNEEDLRNTILHELAHLDKEAYMKGHNADWKRVARNYSRTYNTSITRTGQKEIKIPGYVFYELHVTYSKQAVAKYSVKKNAIHKYRRKGDLTNYLNRILRMGNIVEAHEVREVKE